MKKVIMATLIAVVLWPSYAMGEVTGHVISENLGRLVNAVACTASLPARTITFRQGQTAGFEIISFQVEETWDAATSFEMYCESSQNDQASWGTFQSCQKSGSVFSCTDAILSHPLSASDQWIYRFETVGSPNVRCIWSCTAGTGSDLVTMYGRLAAP